MEINLENGKYTYVFGELSGKQEIYRHGELWRDETGNRFLLAMAQEINELKEDLWIARSSL